MKRFTSRRPAFTSTFISACTSALCAALLLASAPVQARDPARVTSATAQPAPKAEPLPALNPDTLSSAMRDLLTAAITRNLQGTLKYVAPRKIQTIAATMGKSQQETLAELVRIGQAIDQRDSIKLRTGSYDLDAGQYGKTSAGREYALFPYRRTFEKNGSTFERTDLTLASIDQGQIFITPISDDLLLPELIALYPDLAEVPFPAGTLGHAANKPVKP